MLNKDNKKSVLGFGLTDLVLSILFLSLVYSTIGKVL